MTYYMLYENKTHRIPSAVADERQLLNRPQSYNCLLVDFGRIFDYGQAYVALNRTLEGLIIKGFDHNKIVANREVKEFYAHLE